MNLLNRKKLLSLIGRDDAPVIVQCPDCEGIYQMNEWWAALQQRDLEIFCECGTVYEVKQLLFHTMSLHTASEHGVEQYGRIIEREVSFPLVLVCARGD